MVSFLGSKNRLERYYRDCFLEFALFPIWGVPDGSNYQYLLWPLKMNLCSGKLGNDDENLVMIMNYKG